jgi:hypothetical protein
MIHYPVLRSMLGALKLALLFVAGCWSSQALACTVTNPTTTPDFGTFSPAAVKGNAVPAGTVSGGINCSGTVISLLGGNVLTGTLGSTNGYKMTPINGGEPVTFKVYVDQAATKQMSTTGSMNFLDTQLVDLVGLLGNSPSNIPLYVKPASANPVAADTYTGTFTIAWVWKFCSTAWVGSSCTLGGTVKQGSATATINFTMKVAAKPVTIAISSVTTWDNVSGTTNPRALPSSKRRATITLNNTDIVAVDAASLIVDLPIASNTAIALDGDGTGGQVIQSTPGSSGLTVNYLGPAATNDNVEFSSDGGATFTYIPAIDSISQAAVTTVRFRPQGSMAAGSTFVLSVPYTVR